MRITLKKKTNCQVLLNEDRSCRCPNHCVYIIAYNFDVTDGMPDKHGKRLSTMHEELVSTNESVHDSERF